MSKHAKTLLVATMLLVAATAPAAAFVHGEDETTPEIQQYATGPSFIVEFEDDKLSSLQSWANSSENRQLIRYHNASNTATIAAPRAQIVDSLWARVTSGQVLATALEERSYVTAVHPNYVLSNAEPVAALANESDWVAPQVGRFAFNDPNYPTEGVKFDNANETTMAEAATVTGAANMTATGAGTTVGVVDTECNTAGGTLGIQGDILNKSASFLGDGVETVNEGGYAAIEGSNGHGSWVTAAITGDSAQDEYDGIAPDAKVLCLQALSSDGSGSTSDIASAIRYAADSGASVDVLTMSLGSQVWSEPLADAVRYAFKNSDIKAITVASGNSRQTAKFVASPADVPGVVAVGASTGQQPQNADSAYFSQVSGQSAADTSLKGTEEVDVSAPGMRVTARVPTTAGGADNRTLSGTSMATPIVAGNVLLALEANSTLASMNHTGVHDAITATARPAPRMAMAETGEGVMASDNLASGTVPSTSQEDARISAAKQRDIYYEALADGSGGGLLRLKGWLGGAS